MRLSFAWWNTALSPSGKSRANDEQKEHAFALINRLLAEFEVDFLALGEVCEADVRYFREQLDDEFSVQHSSWIYDSAMQFYTGFIWRWKILDFVDFKNKCLLRGKRSFRLAQQIKLIVTYAGRQYPMHLLVSHWPSRRYLSCHDPIRGDLGIRLRDSVDVSLEETKYVLLMGDYNDEPFDMSLSDHLQATRDKHFARLKPHLLYNPFWRHMTYPVEPVNIVEFLSFAGSYYHKQGDLTRWRTFDQIMFSSAFLGNAGWHLNEELTGILGFPEYLSWFKRSKNFFDHLPVIGVIEVDNG